MEGKTLFAGFGGQGILFAGKVLSYIGLIDDNNVSWLPSYGPEMRGGTANCSVCISKSPIGSPIVLEPENLIVMNIPSFKKFEASVCVGGNIILDSSLIKDSKSREDIFYYDIPATYLAKKNNLEKLGNIIKLGKFKKIIEYKDKETVVKVIEKSVSKKRKELIEKNIEAFEIGYNN